ncbi:TIGR01212 family radical SAM protein [Thiohalobacter thiocyanaticus]|uniref:TIGR01212 family radical SAM protein n=1 Tax=Thiohalobacter thiocyanaticus TaxID=585455 RepID=A0A426QIY8_9GAMM|nr:TIGR01212 family radical SAM protein [Thiohalobacter thiocyanaticus]RRQ21731.1 TIGR01212 family radical SAM protein [Thiohalobacter thiocyanaticus]
MALSDYVNTLGQDLLRRHGERVHKLSLHAGFTCPNRDGSKGVGGCSFCNNASFAPMARERAAVREQIASGRRVIRRRTGARRYIAYFQAYTNTYGELERLKALYDEALAEPDVIGLAIGTRPDCVPDAVLDLLTDYRDQGYEIWLELGLQSAFDATLERVNRGHGWAEYAATLRAARGRGLAVCTHLIIGLPGEERWHARQSLLRVLALGVDGLKLHPLHVVKGTRLANEWRRGEYRPLTLEEYVDTAAELIAVTPPEVVWHRVTATAAERILLAPAWCARKWRVLNAIEAALAARVGGPATTQEVGHGTGLSGR